MKKLLIILATIAVCHSPSFSQDSGELDSLLIECDSLIVGRSMPIAFRVVNDKQLNAILTHFHVEYLDGASARFDSVTYVNRLNDPSIFNVRECGEFQDTSNFQIGFLSFANANYLPQGNDAIVNLYFTGVSVGDLVMDSVHLEPTYEFVFSAKLPDKYEVYEPQFVKKEIRIVAGSANPILNIEKNVMTNTAGSLFSTGISVSSPVGYPVNIHLKEFTKYDNTETTTNLPTIIENDGYAFEWTPSISDIGIWQAVIEGCDSSGTCVEGKIIIQVVESGEFLMEFTSKEISNFHQPQKMLWEDLDNDLYPDIITTGYNADLHSTLAVYDFDYNNYTLTPGFIASGSVFQRPTISLGFVDTDNVLDIVHPAIMPTPAVNVLSGLGGFEFDSENQHLTLSSEILSRSAVLSDFNGDEFIDYACAGVNSVFIFTGLGTGYFTEGSKIELSEKIRSINSADFNGDGNNDLAIGTDAGVYIYHNLGNAVFQFINFYAQSYGTVDIDITNQGSDFNGDNYYDFVITTPSVGGQYSEIVLYKGKIDGSFDTNPVRTLKGQVFGVCIGDFNNDNYLDVAFVNGSYKYIGILYGDGSGDFENEQRFFIADIPLFSINCVDYDLDGDLDISSVGTDNEKNGTLFLLENKNNSMSVASQSFNVDIVNNAVMQMTSPNGKKINDISSTFTSSSTYLKNIDDNNIIDKVYSLKTVEYGAYRIKLSPKINIQFGKPFSADFSINNERFCLAKNIPMTASGYTFLIYPTGSSQVNPIPGQFTGEKQPLFTWDVGSEVNFQLASDIDFKQLIIDSVVSENSVQLLSDLPVTDTTAYFWRVKPITQDTYDGIYVFNLVNKVPTDIGDDGDALPSGFSLSQNYPNPFNPTTQLRFSLPKKGHVKMDIYNIVGQIIRTLIDREYPAGEYSVEWDGNTADGNKAASGIYLMKFNTDSFSKSIKMVMMK